MLVIFVSKIQSHMSTLRMLIKKHFCWTLLHVISKQDLGNIPLFSFLKYLVHTQKQQHLTAIGKTCNLFCNMRSLVIVWQNMNTIYLCTRGAASQVPNLYLFFFFFLGQGGNGESNALVQQNSLVIPWYTGASLIHTICFIEHIICKFNIAAHFLNIISRHIKQYLVHL